MKLPNLTSYYVTMSYGSLPIWTTFRYKGEFYYKNNLGEATIKRENKIKIPLDSKVGVCYTEFRKIFLGK